MCRLCTLLSCPSTGLEVCARGGGGGRHHPLHVGRRAARCCVEPGATPVPEPGFPGKSRAVRADGGNSYPGRSQLQGYAAVMRVPFLPVMRSDRQETREQEGPTGVRPGSDPGQRVGHRARSFFTSWFFDIFTEVLLTSNEPRRFTEYN